MPARRVGKKTTFVPRIVFRAAFAGTGAIPLCVVAFDCGSGGLSVANQAFADGGDASARHDGNGFDGPIFSVAAIGFDAGHGDGSSVIDGAEANGGRDGGPFTDGGGVSDSGDAGDALHVPPGVAAWAFEMFD
jgi:hypothetical protein